MSSDTPFLDRLYYAFLPMLTLVLVIVAHMMRMTRASVLAVMASPYIEMAILKGLTQTRIVLRHALPNALAPIISVIALTLPISSSAWSWSRPSSSIRASDS